ncbi:MAG: ribosomal protein S18-alanine N-acetyltransferase [Deltaproteobacteria bacterium]|nr:ribosomal protein S18-alanine N-acetyltransferase [Deltaproteobacteria bacterium]NCP78193.1 ribosomal protein S18-alanine N-acetyltransferase [Desulfuromonadales bacterium]
MQNFLLRTAQKSDLPVLLELERTAYPHPWTEEHFIQEFDNPCAHLELLLFDVQLAGSLCFWILCDELHILNIATSPALRRQGVAAALLRHAFTLARRHGATRALLEVRCSNAAAIALYRRFGFMDDAIRRRYYPDGEDALLMSCRLDQPGGEEIDGR